MPHSNPETPYLLLDQKRLDANCARMRKHLNALGVRLRPHVKTNKSIQASEHLFPDIKDYAQRPITVSTLHEADYFFEAGYRDILYGVAIAPNKFEHAASLIRQGAALLLILDNLETAQALSIFAIKNNIQFNVLLEIDCDGHRSGLPPASPILLQIADYLQSTPVCICGLMTHAGDSYNAKSEQALIACAHQERDAVTSSAQLLRQHGVSVDIVSMGSTPTALFAQDLTGVTEVRAGVFAFFDLVMAGLGICNVDDIAISVVTTVIGHQKEKGWTIVDAGWMALSRDRGTANQKTDQGYGLVCDMNARPIADLIVSGANQEHGIISSRSGSLQIPHLPVGTQLRIFPNHACATAAQYNGYYLDNTNPPVFWPRINGW